MKVVTMGEMMMRLTPPGYSRFEQANTFDVNFGGAEANVAAALAIWGDETFFVSKVPSHEIGQAAVNSLRALGAETCFVLRGGERLGIYYAERGVDLRGGKVIYDRNKSAFSLSDANEYDWEKIFDRADWFHITGITPALGEKAQELAFMACKEAKNRNIKVSFDVNYRSKLWEMTEAKDVMEKLLGYTDVCIVNENQAHELFGVSGEKAIQEFAKKYSLNQVAFTYRRTKDARHNKIWGMLYLEGKVVKSREYDMEMTDRIGGGDAFSAGLIYALGHGYEAQKAIDFAEAASCLKHSVEGDVCLVSIDEIEKVCKGQGYGINR